MSDRFSRVHDVVSEANDQRTFARATYTAPLIKGFEDSGALRVDAPQGTLVGRSAVCERIGLQAKPPARAGSYLAKV